MNLIKTKTTSKHHHEIDLDFFDTGSEHIITFQANGKNIAQMTVVELEVVLISAIRIGLTELMARADRALEAEQAKQDEAHRASVVRGKPVHNDLSAAVDAYINGEVK